MVRKAWDDQSSHMITILSGANVPLRPALPTWASDLSSRQAMLGCHLIEFHCEIKSEEQRSWAETIPSSIITGPLGLLSLIGFVQAHSPLGRR